MYEEIRKGAKYQEEEVVEGMVLSLGPDFLTVDIDVYLPEK